MSYRILSPRYTSLPMPAVSTVDASTPSLYWPSEADRAPTHCGNCGARLLRAHVPTADAPLVDVDCLLCSRTACELKHESLRPRQRVPFVDEPRLPSLKPRHPCADCGRSIQRSNVRCRDCHDAHREATGLTARIVVALGDGRPLPAAALARQLGTDHDTLRHAVRKARAQGRRIAMTAEGYRLEPTP